MCFMLVIFCYVYLTVSIPVPVLFDQSAISYHKLALQYIFSFLFKIPKWNNCVRTVTKSYLKIRNYFLKLRVTIPLC